jgi:hypothetical protein
MTRAELLKMMETEIDNAMSFGLNCETLAEAALQALEHSEIAEDFKALLSNAEHQPSPREDH